VHNKQRQGRARKIFSQIAKADIEPGTLLLVLKELFNEADVDGSGELDREELCAMLMDYYEMEGRRASWVITQEEVDDAIHIHDRDSNGLIDFEEFVAMFSAGAPFRSQLPKAIVAEVGVMAQRLSQATEQFEAQVTAVTGHDEGEERIEMRQSIREAIQTMEQCSSSQRVQMQCCSEILRHARTMWGQEEAVSEGCMRALTVLLSHPTHKNAVHCVVLALRGLRAVLSKAFDDRRGWSLSHKPSECIMAMQAASVVMILHSTHSEIQALCAALLCCVATEDYDLKEQLGQSGVIEAASATMLNHSADKKVLQCCAMALNNLCLESNRNKAFNFCHR